MTINLSAKFRADSNVQNIHIESMFYLGIWLVMTIKLAPKSRFYKQFLLLNRITRSLAFFLVPCYTLNIMYALSAETYSKRGRFPQNKFSTRLSSKYAPPSNERTWLPNLWHRSQDTSRKPPCSPHYTAGSLPSSPPLESLCQTPKG